MTTEYLLDAIGLLDDDLIQDAEVRPAPAVSFSARLRRWGGLAACLILVLAIGYGVSYIQGENNSSSGNSQSAGEPGYGSNTTASSGLDPANSTATGTPETGGGLIYVGASTYSLSSSIADTLPDNCRSLGTLSSLLSNGSSPSTDTDDMGEYVGCELWTGSVFTDTEEYVGCELWAADSASIPSAIYIQLPSGGYAVAELVQP